MLNIQSFSEIERDMLDHGMKLPGNRVYFALEDPKKWIELAFNHFLRGEELAWLPEYDHVADWLSGNDGRGLFLYGNCGRGKSMLCRYVIPAILLKNFRKVVRVFDMQEVNRNIDNALVHHILALDDVGTEENSVKYGERRNAFAEVMDSVEKQGKLILVSTNLGEKELRERYGDRVLDRIISTTKRVVFTGKSLRK